MFLTISLGSAFALSGTGTNVNIGIDFILQGYDYKCVKSFTCNIIIINSTEITFVFNEGIYTISQMVNLGYFTASPIISYNSLPTQQLIINGNSIDFVGNKYNVTQSAFYDLWNQQYWNFSTIGSGILSASNAYVGGGSQSYQINRIAFSFSNNLIPTNSNIISIVFQFVCGGIAQNSQTDMLYIAKSSTMNGWFQGDNNQIVGNILYNNILVGTSFSHSQYTNITLDNSVYNQNNPFTNIVIRSSSDIQQFKPDKNTFQDIVDLGTNATLGNIYGRLVIIYQSPSGIAINCNLNNAPVYIDGILKGYTPIAYIPISLGTHYITFGDITNWDTPNPITIVSSFGKLATITVRYSANFGNNPTVLFVGFLGITYMNWMISMLIIGIFSGIFFTIAHFINLGKYGLLIGSVSGLYMVTSILNYMPLYWLIIYIIVMSAIVYISKRGNNTA